jgi:ubiquinone/menaquinone biosynthesis C-methylase UbiE
MTIKTSRKDLSDYFQILESNNFHKEEFLFNSTPYISGMERIINITQKTVNNRNSNILDLGCGTGLTSYLLSKNAHLVTGLDVYEIQTTQFYKNDQITQKKLWGSLSKNKKNLKFELYNGIKTSFKKNTFDLISLHAVFEHISINKRSLLLKEIYRILKNKGYLVIARTPNKYAITEFLAKSHEYKFSKNEILNLILNNNYKIIRYEKTDFFPEIGPNKFFQNLLNYIYPVIRKIDYFINKTPLSIFSHHHFIILQKNDK